MALFAAGPSRLDGQEIPDIRSVVPDLALPTLSDGKPAAGRRVKQVLPQYEGTELYHVLYLPTNYRPNQPLIVEFAGNGGYRNRYGDRCEGMPEGSRLGFGISGGRDFAWLCLPFVTEDQKLARQWWGSPPNFSPAPTVDYAKQAVAHVLGELDLDAEAVLLCGFSRGAIAVNFIGLHDDNIASLWCGFVAYSHYDGVRDWGLPGTDAHAARQRLRKLQGRPQFICHEMTVDPEQGLARTQRFIDESAVRGNFTFQHTGFRNHSDAWTLRDCPARQELREWLHTIPAIERALKAQR